MTIIRQFNFSDPVITASKTDNSNNFIWLAFSKNSDDNCVIEKQFFSQPSQTFFTINRPVDEVRNMDLSSSYLYAVYNDSTAFAERFSLSNPLTSFTQISRPAGINESAIDVLYDGVNVWILTPGSASGEPAKLLKYNVSLSLQETIELTKSGSTVLDAISLASDSSGDLWVVTNTAPAQYIRVYALSGGGYDFSVHDVI